MGFFKGKKTFVVAILMVAYGVTGYLLGETDQATLFRLVLEAAGIVTLRLGIKKAEPTA